MSYVSQFAPHLPYLRRYARALTGSQDSGDAYIKASLTALAADPSRADMDMQPQVALYRFFHLIWGTTGAQLDSGAENDETTSGKLQALAPIQRQAFLLTSLEGFSITDTAVILDVSSADVKRLIDEAQADIEKQLVTQVMIIEDEPVIAADIESLVEDLGHTVVGIATTRDEAVAMAEKSKPGLVLCDIQLADNSSGIDAAQDILADQNIPIIFITAFPERLLTGEKPEPTYLITKPFQENTVKAAIGQALFFHPAQSE